MKLFHVVLVAGLMVLFASVGYAQTPIDPGIGLGGTGTCEGCFFTQSGATLTGSVPLDQFGNQTIDITNATGEILPFVTITIPTAEVNGPLSCFLYPYDGSGDLYFDPTQTVTGSNFCTFSGPQTTLILDAVPVGVTYGVEFHQFTPSSTLDFTITTVPEPGTVLLLGTGLAAFVARRKWRKGIQSNS